MVISRQGIVSVWYDSLDNVISQPYYKHMKSINEVLRTYDQLLESTFYESTYRVF